MKKQILSMMMAIMMIISILPTTAFANEDGTVSSDGVDYLVPVYVDDIASNGIASWKTESVTESEYISVTNTSTSWSDSWYVVDADITISSRITVSGDVHLILVNGCTLTASAGITVEGTDSLTIYAQSTEESTMGKLVATSADSSKSYSGTDAGIGGTIGNSAGTITINGGDITATGGESSSSNATGAGIGGGGCCYSPAGDGGTITINGGIVTASGGYGGKHAGTGAGIGGGGGYSSTAGAGGTITINGGTITATGGDAMYGASSGAGIGGGGSRDNVAGSGGNITINDGEINATGGDTESSGGGSTFTSSTGAGIGGGGSRGNVAGSGGTVSINGGAVTATGGADTTTNAASGAGIGGGGTYSGTAGSGGTVTIEDGTVIATGGGGTYYGAAIGKGGKYNTTLSASGTITIGKTLYYGTSSSNSFTTFTVGTGTAISNFSTDQYAKVQAMDLDWSITTQPVGSSYTYGDTIRALSVAITENTSGVTYQWYSCGSDGSNATKVTDATTSTYLPTVSNAGTYYYYCAVSVTEDGITATAMSNIATVTIAAKELTVTPSSNQSKYYGETDSTFTYTYTGNLTGETPSFTGSLERVAGESVGTYVISNKDLALANNDDFLASNYKLVFATTSVSYEIKEYTTTDKVADPTDWLSADTVTLTAPTGYTISLTNGVSDTFTDTVTVDADEKEDATVTYYLKSSTGAISTAKTFTYSNDQTAPEAEILIKTNSFQTFVNDISFGLFFKETVDVTISGTDDSSGVDAIYYQLVEEEADYDGNGVWTEYASFSVAPNNQFIVYAKIVDEAGNSTIINSDGVTVYTDSEQDTESFDFIKDSDGDQTISVTLNGNSISSVIYGDRTVSSAYYTIDGNEITFSADYLETFERGSYTFYISYNPMGSEYDSSVAGNQSPNKTTVTVNIYELAVVTMDGVAIENVLIGDTLTQPEDPTKAGYLFQGWMLDGVLYDFDTVITQDIALVSSWEAVEEQQLETTGTADVTIDSDTRQQLIDELFSAEEIALNVEMKATVNVDIVAAGDLDADTQARFDAYLADYSASLGDDTTATQAMVFDISIIKSLDGVEETITNLTTPITITIAIPEEFQSDDRTFFILRDHDGEITYLADEDDDPTTVTFTTDCFSNYTLNYTETVVDTDTDADADVDVNADADVDTGDHGTALPIMMALSMLGMAVLIKKQKLVR